MEELVMTPFEKETLRDILSKVNVYVNTSYVVEFTITPRQQEHLSSLLKKLSDKGVSH